MSKPPSIHQKTKEGLLVLAMTCCLLFTYPLLSLWERGEPIFGLPPAFFWLNAVWLLPIVLTRLILRRENRR